MGRKRIRVCWVFQIFKPFLMGRSVIGWVRRNIRRHDDGGFWVKRIGVVFVVPDGLDVGRSFTEVPDVAIVRKAD